MGLQFILVLCLAGVFCLAPLAVYLLWLAKLTRRHRPTVVSGPWDFAGLMIGLSGFILFGGGLVLSLLQSNMRYWMRGNFEGLRGAWGQEKLTWLFLAGLYSFCVMSGMLFSLLGRRRSLVVYNVEPAAFEIALAEVFEHLNRPIERRGNLWVSGEPLLELDRFPRGRTVNLRWITDDLQLFQEVDRLLREAVRSLFIEDNPSSQWLLAGTIGASFGAVCCFGILVYAFRFV